MRKKMRKKMSFTFEEEIDYFINDVEHDGVYTIKDALEDIEAHIYDGNYDANTNSMKRALIKKRIELGILVPMSASEYAQHTVVGCDKRRVYPKYNGIRYKHA